MRTIHLDLDGDAEHGLDYLCRRTGERQTATLRLLLADIYRQHKSASARVEVAKAAAALAAGDNQLVAACLRAAEEMLK